jgi:anti-sigma regulatory factor (Ser/Thr protein kinase)
VGITDGRDRLSRDDFGVAQDLELSLPSRAESVGKARRAADPLLAGLSHDTREGVRVIISELVTNAIKHGPGGAVTLRLRRDGGAVHGEVEDEGEEMGVSPDRMGGPHVGFGLRVVNALSDSWGVREGSTHVWFELSDWAS